ncbi:hypothetical protein RF55_13252 [Lasius niger]|uniref:Reverse transcriptase n=1 Tax=Lasius niger TaxID=67767 RepID=A0A0J7KB35_LASNI|nr:hypothetical protein RF55_13252 [Lasius niger]
MFDLRPAKLTLRRKFEARVWKGDEPFSNYYHEKVILANRVPVAKDELLDYLIENIQLRNQARLMKFRSGAELLEAFKSIVFERGDRRTGPPGGAGAAGWRGGNTRPAVGGGPGASSAGPGRTESRGVGVEPAADGRAGLLGSRQVWCYRCGEDVRIKIKFYTVPDDAMTYNVLLGRDFLTCPLIRVTLGKTIEIIAVEEMSVVGEIMSIESGNDSVNVRDELRINENIGRDNLEEICEAYESYYLEGLRAGSGTPDFEMTIALKHEQPIASRPCRLSFADKEALRDILDRLLSKGTIRHSRSLYASPIVLVKKKDGSLRCETK